MNDKADFPRYPRRPLVERVINFILQYRPDKSDRDVLDIIALRVGCIYVMVSIILGLLLGWVCGK